jgi:4-hydroxy-tetrahydrodipicolinate reductase
VIDVSNPDAMVPLAQLALQNQKSLPAFVIGSTGWKPDQKNILKRLSEITPVLVASNFSIGIYALSEILRNYSPLLKSIGYTPVIVETHHCHKKDAPSGTAITLQLSIDENNPESIQTHSIRAGEVIGTHDVTFYGQSDELTFRHLAQDRTVFARGAIQTALWVAQEKQTRTHMTGLMGIGDYFTSLLESFKTQ